MLGSKLLVSLAITLVSLSFATPFVAAGAKEYTAAGITWNTEFSQGLESAKKSNKYVLADIYTDWCGWCKRLDSTTFADPQMAKYLNEDFVCVKCNAEDNGEGQKVADGHGIHAFPTALIFNSDGKMIGTITGYLDASKYEAKLREIIAKHN